MTDDLVKRLRSACNGHPHAKIPWPHRVLHEAADRIAALEAALRWIKEMPLPAPPLDDPAHSMRTIATRALEEGPE